MNTPTIDDIRHFWETNPLWTGESAHPAGSLEFFEEHRRVTIADCLGGAFDERLLPPPENRSGVLDLGCGPGFWTVELALRGCTNITAADLTQAALDLASRRCSLYGVPARFSRQNAEKMTFPDGAFSHVNCQGVIHHTPDIRAAVSQIARVLRPGGTAGLSVYHLNAPLRLWPAVGWIGKLLARLGARLPGRAREHIFRVSDPAEIVRLYDGADNPLGRAYTRSQFLALLSPHFEVREVFYHFFPARALPFRLPGALHRFLDRRLGFMIYVSAVKKPSAPTA